MAHYTGKDLYVSFGGTAIDGDQRSFDVSRTSDTAESSAGSDTDKSYLATLNDASGSMEILCDNTEGTAIKQILYEGNTGELLWGQEGTASGKEKYGCSIIITGVDESNPYADVAMYTFNWQKNGTWTYDYRSLGSTW